MANFTTVEKNILLNLGKIDFVYYYCVANFQYYYIYQIGQKSKRKLKRDLMNIKE